MLTVVIMVGLAAVVVSLGGLLLLSKGAKQTRHPLTEAAPEPDAAWCHPEADDLKRKLREKAQELERARQHRQQSDERVRSLERALGQVQGQRDQERSRSKELGEAAQVLTEQNNELRAQVQKCAELLKEAEEAGTTLTRRHSDLARRHEALVHAVEEHGRALGTPGWYAESLRLVWQAAGTAGNAESARLPPLPEFLSECIRHWQGLCPEQAPAPPPLVPHAARGRNGVHHQTTAN
jgi:hypothetical protein